MSMKLSPPTIRPDHGGTILECHIQPGAAAGRIAGEYDGRLKIAVAAPPVDGKANAALIRFFSKKLAIPPSRIQIVNGETGRKKRLFFVGLTPEQLVDLLAPHLPE